MELCITESCHLISRQHISYQQLKVLPDQIHADANINLTL